MSTPRAQTEDAGRPSVSPRLLFWVLLAVAALIAYVVLVLAPQMGSNRGVYHPAAGQRVPPFEVWRFAKPPQSARVPKPGTVTVVNFWGTWCPPCRVELPHIAELARRYDDRDDFRLLAVSCSPGGADDLEQITSQTEQFLDRQNIELAVYADPSGQARMKVFSLLDKSAYPTTIIVDKSGTLRGAWVGYRPGYEQEQDALVQKLLAE